MFRQTPRPIPPPDLEGRAQTPFDPADSTVFAPELGSLPMWGEEGIRNALPMKVPGPIQFVQAFITMGGGAQVQVGTGALHFYPKPLVKADPTVTEGGSIVYRLVYRSDRAKMGYGSPGLPPGWLHPFDVTASCPVDGTWGAVTVAFANGGTQEFTPELTPDNRPTGKFARNFDQVLMGVPSQSVPGRWESLKLAWRGGSTWEFLAVPSTNSLVLRAIDGTTLGWDNQRRLLGIYNKTVNNPFFLCKYGGNGLLEEVSSKHRDYALLQYGATASGKTQLATISERGNRADTTPPGVRYSFDYTKDRFGLLSRIAVADGPRKWFSAYTAYEDGFVVRRGDDDGNRRLYTRVSEGVQIEIYDKSGKRLYQSLMRFDSKGRYTGFTDSRGNSDAIRYDR